MTITNLLAVALPALALGALIGWAAAALRRNPLSSAAAEMPAPVSAPLAAVLARSAEGEQLALLERELNSLIYSVSHDVRAPLRSIDGFSQALLEDYGEMLDATAQGYIERVRANTRRINGYIEHLLSLSRLCRADLRRETVDLSAIASTLCEKLQQGVPGRRVSWTVEPGLTAQGDRELLTHCLRHLLENAWKFTSGRDEALVHCGSVRGQTGVFFVRDNGVGLDMHFAGKLFGAFQRMHPPEEFPGAGIGLASAQRILLRHGGRIWVEAAPDAGATFFFTVGPQTNGGGSTRDTLGTANARPGRKAALQSSFVA